jgi:WXG100 family type VII secretion target
MTADNNLRVDPQMMHGFAQALLGGAENLRNQLAGLDGQVGEMLGGWQGGSGGAYSSAWERWHRGAREIEAGLSILARAVAHAGVGFQHNEAVSTQAIRQVLDG